MGANPRRPTALWNSARGTTPIKPLMGFQARSSGHGSHCDFPLTSPNCELHPKYLQDLARNDTTVLLLVGVNKILPSSAHPMAGRDAGYGMWDAPTLGPLGGFCLTEVFGEGSELRMGAKVRSSPVGWQLALAMERLLQSSVAKTFIELFSKCTEGCVYPAAYNCFFGRIPNTWILFFFSVFPFFCCCRMALTLWFRANPRTPNQTILIALWIRVRNQLLVHGT